MYLRRVPWLQQRLYHDELRLWLQLLLLTMTARVTAVEYGALGWSCVLERGRYRKADILLPGL